MGIQIVLTSFVFLVLAVIMAQADNAGVWYKGFVALTFLINAPIFVIGLLLMIWGF